MELLEVFGTLSQLAPCFPSVGIEAADRLLEIGNRAPQSCGDDGASAPRRRPRPLSVLELPAQALEPGVLLGKIRQHPRIDAGRGPSASTATAPDMVPSTDGINEGSPALSSRRIPRLDEVLPSPTSTHRGNLTLDEVLHVPVNGIVDGLNLLFGRRLQVHIPEVSLGPNKKIVGLWDVLPRPIGGIERFVLRVEHGPDKELAHRR